MPPDSPQAVRYFVPDNPQDVCSLRARLAKQMADLSQAVADGYCVDFADYKSKIGEIRGLKFAILVCDEAEREENR